MLKEPGHLHILYAGQWKFGRASRIYITLVWWACSLEMLISIPEESPDFVPISPDMQSNTCARQNLLILTHPPDLSWFIEDVYTWATSSASCDGHRVSDL